MEKKGYIIVNVEIIDPDGYKEYVSKVVPYMSRNGGRFLVATNEVDQREGDFGLIRLVAIEFPSVQIARQIYEADEYQREILPLRARATRGDLVIVEGLQ